jgi:ribonuclease P protein component
MLKKENRLTSRFEFNKVRYLANKNGTKYSSPLFHIFFIESSAGPSKFGIVVSNKYHKSAVVRNNIKRIYREVIREHFGKIKGGFWIVIHPRKASADRSYEEISTEFIKAIQKLSLA